MDLTQIDECSHHEEGDVEESNVKLVDTTRDVAILAALERGLRALAGSCEACGCPDGVELEGARTMYTWDGEGSDPNRRQQLCRPCAKYHHAYWDEMWNQGSDE